MATPEVEGGDTGVEVERARGFMGDALVPDCLACKEFCVS